MSALWRVARRLHAVSGAGPHLPPLLFFTDPDRTPDPAAVLRRLPQGAGVVYRAFGRADALETGRRLAAIARARGLVFLVGADAGLAIALNADGVHLPQRLANRPGLIRRLRPRFTVTAAAHDLAAARRAQRAGAEAVVVSPVFHSRSPSAGRPLGTLAFAALVGKLHAPVYALGGINAGTAPRLSRSGAAGVAAIEGLMSGSLPPRSGGSGSRVFLRET